MVLPCYLTLSICVRLHRRKKINPQWSYTLCIYFGTRRGSVFYSHADNIRYTYVSTFVYEVQLLGTTLADGLINYIQSAGQDRDFKEKKWQIRLNPITFPNSHGPTRGERWTINTINDWSLLLHSGHSWRCRAFLESIENVQIFNLICKERIDLSIK